MNGSAVLYQRVIQLKIFTCPSVQVTCPMLVFSHSAMNPWVRLGSWVHGEFTSKNRWIGGFHKLNLMLQPAKCCISPANMVMSPIQTGILISFHQPKWWLDQNKIRISPTKMVSSVWMEFILKPWFSISGSQEISKTDLARTSNGWREC